jgi:hypothetical protein
MIKFLSASSLWLLTFTVSISAVEAQPTIVNRVSDRLSPSELVILARNGRFDRQGIPGYSAFRQAILSGKINARRLVEIAIDQNRLPPETLDDPRYLSQVSKHLQAGGCGK